MMVSQAHDPKRQARGHAEYESRDSVFQKRPLPRVDDSLASKGGDETWERYASNDQDKLIISAQSGVLNAANSGEADGQGSAR